MSKGTWTTQEWRRWVITADVLVLVAAVGLVVSLVLRERWAVVVFGLSAALLIWLRRSIRPDAEGRVRD